MVRLPAILGLAGVLLLGGGACGAPIPTPEATPHGGPLGALRGAPSTPAIVATSPADPCAGQVGRPGCPDPRARAPGHSPTDPGQPPPPIPAITPSNPNPAPGEPAFDEADVRAQVAAAVPPGPATAGTFAHTGPLTLTAVAFLPADEVERRLRISLGRPADAPVCLVTVAGTFTRPETPPGPDGDRRPPVMFTSSVLVFDARTGNLLLQGEGE